MCVLREKVLSQGWQIRGTHGPTASADSGHHPFCATEPRGGLLIHLTSLQADTTKRSATSCG